MISIKDIIDKKGIKTRFHPIVSLRSRSVVGFEALSVGSVDGNVIPPVLMFEAAAEEGSLIDLDRECRRSALSTFVKSDYRDAYLLFINFESLLIDMGVVGSGVLLSQCRDLAVRPESVVIEIVESKVKAVDDLRRFVDTYRENGFSIALDDVGEGYSNLNRIAQIRPDIIKADRSLASGVDNDFLKQKIVSSLAALSKGIGSLFLLEGVETEGEALAAFSLGADLAQGYYFAKPAMIEQCDLDHVVGLVSSSVRNAREISIQRIRAHTDFVKGCFEKMEIVSSCLSQTDEESFDACLADSQNGLESCECLYVVDDTGIQVSDTVLSPSFRGSSKASIFHPAPKGSDHSIKEFFYVALLNRRRYVSESYISLASGNRCITLSVPFSREGGTDKYFLCADFLVRES